MLGLTGWLAPKQAHAQIGGEAQGGKLATWVALGLDQELGKRWRSVTDLGYGRHSGNADEHLIQYQGLNVITQDFVYKINQH